MVNSQIGMFSNKLNYIFFEKLFTQKSMGFVYLTSDFRARSANSNFVKFCVKTKPYNNQSIFELIPELIGLETVFEEISTKKRKSFILKKLVREHSPEEIIYFDLSVFLTEQEAFPFFILVEDKTEETVQKQKIMQQQNEIKLLESLLHSRNRHISGSILGNSKAVQQVKNVVEKIAKISSATILLLGESGAGKNLVARVIHYSSPKKETPFVEINCAAIPETLLESELFGYEKGAFTNAIQSKKGLLEEADSGTLFLDEIGELPLQLQAKLLSFLETKRFRRLGSTNEIKVSLRLITATNRNLDEMIQQGKFREDLFYRLNVVKITLPSLKNMGEDVVLIAQHFIQLFNKEFEKTVKGLTQKAQIKLKKYSWPGNVRELRNVIERAMIFAEGDLLDSKDVYLGKENDKDLSTENLDQIQLPKDGLPFEQIEQKILQDALDLANGNQSKAAKLLHLSRDTFRYRLEKYNLI